MVDLFKEVRFDYGLDVDGCAVVVQPFAAFEDYAVLLLVEADLLEKELLFVDEVLKSVLDFHVLAIEDYWKLRAVLVLGVAIEGSLSCDVLLIVPSACIKFVALAIRKIQ